MAPQPLKIPCRLTLDLVRDTFSVMLANMGMTEDAIVQCMAKTKGFQTTTLKQLRQALKLAVNMGLVTFRNNLYMFTTENLERAIAHGLECKGKDSGSLPGPSRCISEPFVNRRRMPSTCGFVSSTRRGGCVGGTKRTISRSPAPRPKRFDFVSTRRRATTAARPKRTMSRLPASRAKRQRLNVAADYVASEIRTRRFDRKECPSDAGTMSRSSAYSSQTDVSAMSSEVDVFEILQRTRGSAGSRKRKSQTQKGKSTKAKTGRGFKRKVVEPRKANHSPGKKNTKVSEVESKTSCDSFEAAENPSKAKRPRTTSYVTKKESNAGTSFERTVTQQSRSTVGKSKREASKVDSKSSCNTDKSDVSVLKPKSQKSVTSTTSKKSLASCSSARTVSSRNSGSSLGSRRLSHASKSASKTSRNSNEAPDNVRKNRNSKSETATMLQEFLSSASLAKTPKSQGSGSSLGSDSSNVSKVSSKSSLITDEEPDGDRKSSKSSKSDKTSTVQKSSARPGRPQNLGSSLVKQKGNASKVESKTSCNSDEEPDRVRKTRVGKSVTTSTVKKSHARTGRPQNLGSSLVKQKGNASKVASKTSCNSDEEPYSARKTGSQTSGPVLRESPASTLFARTIKLKNSKTSLLGRKRSSTKSKSSCDIDEAEDSLPKTKKAKSTFVPGEAVASSSAGVADSRKRSTTRFVGNNPLLNAHSTRSSTVASSLSKTPRDVDEQPDTRDLHDFYT